MITVHTHHNGISTRVYLQEDRIRHPGLIPEEAEELAQDLLRMAKQARKADQQAAYYARCREYEDDTDGYPRS